ncbi:hypothetical protein ACWDYH_07830 [Nocardia goodfellowii]
MTEFAAALSDAAGRQITYTDVPVEQYSHILVGAGLPAPMAAAFADSDRGYPPSDKPRRLGPQRLTCAIISRTNQSN